MPPPGPGEPMPVKIGHPVTGEQYQIDEAVYSTLPAYRPRVDMHDAAALSLLTYEAAGFTVLSYADGAPYVMTAPAGAPPAGAPASTVEGG